MNDYCLVNGHVQLHSSIHCVIIRLIAWQGKLGDHQQIHSIPVQLIDPLTAFPFLLVLFNIVENRLVHPSTSSPQLTPNVINDHFACSSNFPSLLITQAATTESASPAAESAAATETEKTDKSTEKDTSAEEKAPEAAETSTEAVKDEVPAEASLDNTTDSLNESKVSEAGAEGETSSAKKPKKDKVKRLFSLRSLSFGRKDKQKPKKAAKEEAAAAAVEGAAAEGAEKVETEKVSQD